MALRFESICRHSVMQPAQTSTPSLMREWSARKAPTWRLYAKARPGSRRVTWRENFASVLESSSVNQSRLDGYAPPLPAH